MRGMSGTKSARPGPPPHLRLAKQSDVEALGRVIEASVFGLGPAAYTREQLESAMRHVFGVDTRLIEDGTYYAVEGEGDRGVIACGGWSRRRTLFGGDQFVERSDDLLDPATEAARIRAFFVDPASARRGVGRMLLDECERAARAEGFRQLTLMATLTGVEFYERCGFQAVESTELVFPDGVRFPLTRMLRTLNG
jgi:GNAT superfamily N-acetyltransferase